MHTETAGNATTEPPALTQEPKKTLPVQCHGCGALSQTTVPDEAGYYDVSRKAVKQYLGLEVKEERIRGGSTDDIVKQALQSVDVEALAKQGINLKALLPERAPRPDLERAADKTPLCERCHNLIHHSTGNSIYHPSIESLQDTIEESPYKHNHVYHVLDAADFPMSLLPRLHALLDITLRTQNRRSKTVKYQHGRHTEMSFIISRSDLLAPNKEQVDSLMPYIKETLREALGRVGGRVRLGNVHCVSAKRAWWTKELKESIWKRGGAGWMVGKANVGKSQLFEAVFPKGRMDAPPPKHKISVNVFPKPQKYRTLEEAIAADESNEDFEDPNPLLPGRTTQPTEEFSPSPPQPETQFPSMPVVSSSQAPPPRPSASPSATAAANSSTSRASPAPTLNSTCSRPPPSLIMKSRVLPNNKSSNQANPFSSAVSSASPPRNVAPDEELIFLTYPFTPITPHLTATDKAVAVQTQAEDAPGVENIALPGTGATVKHAGAFQVRYDVTKARTGPLTRKEAVGLKVDRLPYRVQTPKVEEQLQTLDLREEPVNAMGNGRDEEMVSLAEAEAKWPVIDVYSPEGKFVGYRRPMNAWMLNKPKGDMKSRPRKSMKGAKKLEKSMRRERESRFRADRD
ncbi:hypothetical protein N0V88_000485 [Collariella sp. IMI 366227]|nr:hypothetical protein N0V88_000485 [Collariella sp. IMI 366227]